ncbi:hypothetical protein GW930_03055 [Candidatus Saccharibacteria bacterium]|nr:hypothetical protein [Candidatus Saccharibacteria bacterium]
MKIKNRYTTKRNLVIALAALLVVGLASLSIYVFAMNGNLFGWQLNPTTQEQSSSETDAIDTEDATPDPESPPTDEQISDGAEIKRDSLTESEQDETPQTTTVQITAASQSAPGETVSIRAFIQKTTNQGTCTLTMSNGNKQVLKTAQIQALPSGSTCKGFDVAFSELSSGTWNATIEYRNGDEYAKDEQSIEVR